MTHHVMNQMGHQFPNMVGIKTEGLEEKLRPLLPAYMTMGHTGMDMGRMAEVMPYPQNTIAMKGAQGRLATTSRWVDCFPSLRCGTS